MLKRLLIAGFLLAHFSVGMSQAKIYVATKAAERSDGSFQYPFTNLKEAIRKARDLRRQDDASIKNGIQIILKDGRYPITESLVFRSEDAGTAQSPTIFQAENNQAIISGGQLIKDWNKLQTALPGMDSKVVSNIWVAKVPKINGSNFNFRQLWVNDQKAVRAKSANGDQMDRILDWNKKERTCIIPTPKFALLDQVENMELFIHQWWEIAQLRIKKIETKGDSTRLYFQAPESKIQSEHPWPAPWLSAETGNSAFYLTNAIQFLDEPGEWYLDTKNELLYYYPRAGENMQTASVIAPYTETLIAFQGISQHPITNIIFKNISFQHSSWMRPSLQGHVPHQVGLYMTEAYKLKPAGTKEKPFLDNQAFVGRPAAAIELNFASQIKFENSSFQHLASNGIDCKVGVSNSQIEGNLFKDIGGNGIIAGNYGDEGREIHMSYHPTNEQEVCDGIAIRNNLITNASNEDWGTVGIAVGYARNMLIEHNEIENVSYSGISMGWGWNATETIAQNNQVLSNHIHHFGKHNYDCAGIYTLSNQPNSLIANNWIDSIYKAPYVHLPSHWFYLYTDEGSSGFTLRNNWTPSEKYLQNANGPNNLWEKNGPTVTETIKKQAGINATYQSMLKEKTAAPISLPINEEHKEIIELVAKENQTFDLQKLKKLLTQNKIDSNAIYQWGNHYVLFDKVQDLSVMQGRLQNNFPETEVRMYHNMFYEFSKRKNCADTSTATEWQDILLTANLVDDNKMQQAYFEAHATQFKKLPQIAEGFCNANFQQLLMFRNGRQLMLVISIPKGETLDHLNPKTVENNLTMIQWNQQMGKYQEGIKGTKAGETWVFLKKITD